MRSISMIICAIMLGCSPEIRVYHEVDPRYTASEHRSVRWAKTDSSRSEKNPLYFNESNDRLIKSAVNDLLAAKGYVLTDSAGLILRYDIRVDDRSVLLPDPYGYMYGDYWMVPRDNIFRYREATLVIDVWSAGNRKLVWRGWAVAAIEAVFNQERNSETIIRSAVAKILDQFPVCHPTINTDTTGRID